MSYSIAFKECENRTYGANCSQHCGHCQNETTCNTVDGDCTEGCASGYNYTKNRTCHEGKSFGFINFYSLYFYFFVHKILQSI